MKPIKHNINQSGFTLIEYIVSLSLGMIIIAVLCGLVQGFWNFQAKINNRSRYWYQNITAEQQITNSVHLAGFAGCVHPPDWQNVLTINKAQNELTIWYASQKNAVLVNWQVAPQVLVVTHQLVFKPGDFFLINNCICSEKNMVKAVIPAGSGLQKIVPDHPIKCLMVAAPVYRVEKDKFFVDVDQITEKKALFMQNMRYEKRMLAANVIDFSVRLERKEGCIRGVMVRYRMEAATQSKERKFFVSPRNVSC